MAGHREVEEAQAGLVADQVPPVASVQRARVVEDSAVDPAHLAALAAAARADVVEQVDSVVEVKEQPVAEVALVVKAEAEQATWSSG